MSFPKMEVELFEGLEEKLIQEKKYKLKFRRITDYEKKLTSYIYTPGKTEDNIEREIVGDMCRLLLQKNTNIYLRGKGKEKLEYEVNLENILEFEDLKFPGNFFQKRIPLDKKLEVFIVLKLLYQRSLFQKGLLDYVRIPFSEIKKELYQSVSFSSKSKELSKLIKNNTRYVKLVQNMSKNIHLMQLILKQNTFNGEVKLKLIRLHCNLQNMKLEDQLQKFMFFHSKDEFKSDFKIYLDSSSQSNNYEINLEYVFYLAVKRNPCNLGILAEKYSSNINFSNLNILELDCLQYKITYHIKLVLSQKNCSLEINMKLDKLFEEFTCTDKLFLRLKKNKSKLSKKTRKKRKSKK